MAAVVAGQRRRCVIKLSGSLAQRFGREHVRELETGSSMEAFSALKHTLDGFEAFISAASRRGLRYAIFRNRRNVGESELQLGGTRELRIVPVIEGSKRGGALQTILGAVLVVAGAFTTVFGDYSGSVIGAGLSLMAGGVIQMISPQPRGLRGREDSQNAPSYAFGGPVNTTAAGNPVGLLYGRRRIGGAIISAGIYAEDIA